MVDISHSDSIYHLHIPRTGGVFLRKHLLEEFFNKPHFSTHRDKLILETLSSQKYVGGHFGTTPIPYMNNPLVFTVLRNPVERFISYAKYTRSFFQKDSMNELLYGEHSNLHANTQTKFITNQIDIESYNKSLVNAESIQKNWFIGQEESFEKAKSFIDNNVVVTLDEIEKLPSILGIKNFKDMSKVNGTRSVSGVSKEQYDKIVSMNELDMEIFNYAKTQKKY
jgi:hypothetical protein